jgi:hypothetical protein
MIVLMRSPDGSNERRVADNADRPVDGVSFQMKKIRYLGSEMQWNSGCFLLTGNLFSLYSMDTTYIEMTEISIRPITSTSRVLFSARYH